MVFNFRPLRVLVHCSSPFAPLVQSVLIRALRRGFSSLFLRHAVSLGHIARLDLSRRVEVHLVIRGLRVLHLPLEVKQPPEPLVFVELLIQLVLLCLVFRVPLSGFALRVCRECGLHLAVQLVVSDHLILVCLVEAVEDPAVKLLRAVACRVAALILACRPVLRAGSALPALDLLDRVLDLVQHGPDFRAVSRLVLGDRDGVCSRVIASVLASRVALQPDLDIPQLRVRLIERVMLQYVRKRRVPAFYPLAQPRILSAPDIIQLLQALHFAFADRSLEHLLQQVLIFRIVCMSLPELRISAAAVFRLAIIDFKAPVLSVHGTRPSGFLPDFFAARALLLHLLGNLQRLRVCRPCLLPGKRELSVLLLLRILCRLAPCPERLDLPAVLQRLLRGADAPLPSADPCVGIRKDLLHVPDRKLVLLLLRHVLGKFAVNAVVGLCIVNRHAQHFLAAVLLHEPVCKTLQQPRLCLHRVVEILVAVNSLHVPAAVYLQEDLRPAVVAGLAHAFHAHGPDPGLDRERAGDKRDVLSLCRRFHDDAVHFFDERRIFRPRRVDLARNDDVDIFLCCAALYSDFPCADSLSTAAKIRSAVLRLRSCASGDWSSCAFCHCSSLLSGTQTCIPLRAVIKNFRSAIVVNPFCRVLSGLLRSARLRRRAHDLLQLDLAVHVTAGIRRSSRPHFFFELLHHALRLLPELIAAVLAAVPLGDQSVGLLLRCGHGGLNIVVLRLHRFGPLRLALSLLRRAILPGLPLLQADFIAVLRGRQDLIDRQLAFCDPAHGLFIHAEGADALAELLVAHRVSGLQAALQHVRKFRNVRPFCKHILRGGHPFQLRLERREGDVPLRFGERAAALHHARRNERGDGRFDEFVPTRHFCLLAGDVVDKQRLQIVLRVFLDNLVNRAADQAARKAEGHARIAAAQPGDCLLHEVADAAAHAESADTADEILQPSLARADERRIGRRLRLGHALLHGLGVGVSFCTCKHAGHTGSLARRLCRLRAQADCAADALRRCRDRDHREHVADAVCRAVEDPLAAARAGVDDVLGVVLAVERQLLVCEQLFDTASKSPHALAEGEQRPLDGIVKSGRLFRTAPQLQRVRQHVVILLRRLFALRVVEVGKDLYLLVRHKRFRAAGLEIRRMVDSPVDGRRAAHLRPVLLVAELQHLRVCLRLLREIRLADDVALCLLDLIHLGVS